MVNLERALRVGDRLGGHLVQGHVDGLGTVRTVGQREDARLLDISVPPAVAEVTVPLGSITVDGVSLTVNAIPRPGLIQVALIPHTLSADHPSVPRGGGCSTFGGGYDRQVREGPDGEPAGTPRVTA